MRFYFLKD